MNYIGYINKAQYFEHTTEIINLMKGHGCVNIRKRIRDAAFF